MRNMKAAVGTLILWLVALIGAPVAFAQTTYQPQGFPPPGPPVQQVGGQDLQGNSYFGKNLTAEQTLYSNNLVVGMAPGSAAAPNGSPSYTTVPGYSAGTVASCVTAGTIGSAAASGQSFSFALPPVARTWSLECEGVVGQATAATANSWYIQTANNGATNFTAWYNMNTAATAMTGGAVTDTASTTTATAIAPSWTLGGTGTKMPFHIGATIEGVSTSGTTVNIQLAAPTVADLVTIYRGAQCHVY